MFKRLIDNISLWFSLKKQDRVATIAVIEEIKETTKVNQVKEVAWFATANNIIDEFAASPEIMHVDDGIRAVATPEDNEEGGIDWASLNHINKLRKEWADKNKVINFNDYLDDQTKKEVHDSMGEGNASENPTN